MKFVALALFGLISTTVIGCSGNDGGQSKQDSVPVMVAKVAKKDIPVELRAVGVVEAYSSVALAAQVGGMLQAIHFIPGQNVKAGDLLFSIDQKPYLVELDQQSANLAKAKVDAAKAKLTLNRYEKLEKQDFTSKEQYDQAKATSDSLDAVVRGMEAAVARTRLDLAYTSISSPIDGRVGDALVKPGNIIKANDSQSPLARINRVHPIFVRFSVPENELPRIKREMDSKALAVRAAPKGEKSLISQGTLTFIDNAVDRTTGTIVLKGTFSNQDESLWPGEFVDVVLTLSVQNAVIVVPSEAVQTGQQGAYVYVVKADRSMENRVVQTGIASATDTVITNGLNADEVVVTDGHLRVGPKSLADIKNPHVPVVAN